MEHTHMQKPSASFTFQSSYLMLEEYLLLLFFFFENFPSLMKNVQSQDKACFHEIIQKNSWGYWALRRGLKNSRKKKKQKCNFSIIDCVLKAALWVLHEKGGVWIDVSLGEARAERGWCGVIAHGARWGAPLLVTRLCKRLNEFWCRRWRASI